MEQEIIFYHFLEKNGPLLLRNGFLTDRKSSKIAASSLSVKQLPLPRCFLLFLEITRGIGSPAPPTSWALESPAAALSISRRALLRLSSEELLPFCVVFLSRRLFNNFIKKKLFFFFFKSENFQARISNEKIY